MIFYVGSTFLNWLVIRLFLHQNEKSGALGFCPWTFRQLSTGDSWKPVCIRCIKNNFAIKPDLGMDLALYDICDINASLHKISNGGNLASGSKKSFSTKKKEKLEVFLNFLNGSNC